MLLLVETRANAVKGDGTDEVSSFIGHVKH